MMLSHSISENKVIEKVLSIKKSDNEKSNFSQFSYIEHDVQHKIKLDRLIFFITNELTCLMLRIFIFILLEKRYLS